MRTPGFAFPASFAFFAFFAFGCGPSPITATRIETAMATTFANLVHLQLSRMELPAVSASDLGVRAVCRRVAAGSDNVFGGSGDWQCTIDWQGPDHRPLRDIYDLFVTTDGCYTATVEGGSIGGPTLKAPDGRDVRNLLYAFDGCFDTT